MKIIFILLIFIVQTATKVEGGEVACGSPLIEPTTTRVVGGTAAKLGNWPWMVILSEINLPVCGGAILTESVIVTAAHCFEDALSQNPSRWLVTAGGIRQDKLEYSQRSYHIEKILMHESYNDQTVENDIALLFLKGSIKFSNFIRPVCLPAVNDSLDEGTICWLAGWGDTHGTGNSKELNQVALPIIGDIYCSKSDWYGTYFHANSTFCAGHAEGGKDACTGDSGAPLVCKQDGKWHIHGIASWGYGCAEPKWPGIYTEVSKFTEWINHHMNDQRSALLGK